MNTISPELGTRFPQSQPLVRGCQFGVSPVNFSYSNGLHSDVGGAQWLTPRTTDPEVGGSSPTRDKPCCVLEQGTFNPPKYRLYPGSGCSVPT